MDESADRDRAERVLIVFPGALGDLICAVAAIRAIAQRYPQARIELMARSELASFASGRIAGIGAGHSIDCREVSAMFREDGGRDAAASRFFGGFAAIHSFFASADAQFRANLAAAAPHAQLAHYPFRPKAPGHVAQAYLRTAGEDCADPDCSIDLLDLDLNSADAVLRRGGLEAGRCLMIFPGSGSPAKNWPLPRFIELAIRARGAASPLFVLGPAEDAIASQIAGAGLPSVRELALGTVAAMARMAAAFVGNDSGVSHLAAAAGGRGIVLFGPTDPRLWRPLGAVRIVSHDPLGDLPVESVTRELRLPGSGERAGG